MADIKSTSKIEIQQMPCETEHGKYSIPYIEVTDVIECNKSSDGQYLGVHKPTQHIFIYGEGFGFGSEYYLEWTDVVKRKFHKSKVDFHNYTNWVDGKKSAHKRMLHWREVLVDEGFTGADVDINDPYDISRSKEWLDSVGKESTNLA